MQGSSFEAKKYLDENQLEQAQALQNKMIDWINNRDLEIPSIPKVISEAVRLAGDPEVTVKTLEDLVSKDQAIAGALIKIANSVLLGGVEKVKTIRAAIVRLGQTELRNILLGAFVETRLFRSKVYGPLIAKLWSHSLACAVVARYLAEKMGADPELAYLSGLLHDVGQASLLYSYIYHTKENDPLPDQVVEFAMRDLHAQAGGLAVKQWGLSDEVVSAITYHHDFTKANDQSQMAALIQLADTLCHRHCIGLSFEEKKTLKEEQSEYQPLKMSYDKAEGIDLTTFAPIDQFPVNRQGLLQRFEARIPYFDQELLTPFVSKARLDIVTPTLKARSMAKRREAEDSQSMSWAMFIGLGAVFVIAVLGLIWILR